MKNMIRYLTGIASNGLDRHENLSKLCDKFLIHQYEMDMDTDDEKYKKIEHWCEANMHNRFCLWEDYICCRDSNDLANFLLRWR